MIPVQKKYQPDHENHRITWNCGETGSQYAHLFDDDQQYIQTNVDRPVQDGTQKSHWRLPGSGIIVIKYCVGQGDRCKGKYCPQGNQRKGGQFLIRAQNFEKRESKYIQPESKQCSDKKSNINDTGKNTFGFLLVSLSHFSGGKIRSTDSKEIVQTELKEVDRVQDVDPGQGTFSYKTRHKQAVIQCFK